MFTSLCRSLLITVAINLPAVAVEIPDSIQQATQKLGLNIQHISPAPLDNFYQVMTDKGLIYLSADGKMMLHGNLYALGDKPQNLTQQAMTQVRKKGVQKLSDTVLSFPAKEEKYKVTVFTDTSCGYCRQLHNQIEDYNKLGISIDYMAFPRAGVPSQAASELSQVWCAKDPAKAMTSAQAGQTLKQQKSCPAPIPQHYKFARQIGIDRTPSMVLESGELLIGYRPPKQLLQMLGSMASQD